MWFYEGVDFPALQMFWPDREGRFPWDKGFPSRRESQLPAATCTLESFLGFHLGLCASAVWTLHRANLRQRAVRSHFKDMKCGDHPGILQSTSDRHLFGMLFGWCAFAIPRR
jgi:hypothetical protein